MSEIYESKIHITPGDYIAEAWSLFKKDAVSFIAFAVITSLLPILQEVFFSDESGISLLISIISVPLYMGYYIKADLLYRNKPHTFSNFFDGFNTFTPLVGVGFLSILLIVLGIFALFLPGIYLIVAYLFSSLLVYFNKMSVWQAMETSRKLVTKNWWAYFGFFWLLILVNIAGILALGIGLLISMPVSYIAIYIAFRKEFPVANLEMDFEDHLIA